MIIGTINEENLSKLFYGDRMKFYGFGRNGFVARAYKTTESGEEGNWFTVDSSGTIVKSMHYIKNNNKIEYREIRDEDLNTSPIEADKLMRFIENAKKFVGGTMTIDRTERGGYSIATNKIIRP